MERQDEFLLRIFASRLRLLREQRSLTLTELSDATGLGVTTLSQYENGERMPKFIPMAKIAIYFNVSLDWLMGLSDERRASQNAKNTENEP